MVNTLLFFRLTTLKCNYRSQNLNCFFFELCMILLLFPLLKNAPKKTLSEQMCPKAPQWPPRFLSKVGHVCKQVQKNMKDSLKSLAETTTRMHREGGRVQGRNHFVTKYRSQNMNDFFLELYLILLLFLLLKNAPKQTLSKKMCPKAPQWRPKWVPNGYKIWFFSQVGHVWKQGVKK